MFLIATEGFTVHNLSDFACGLISALHGFPFLKLISHFYSEFIFIQFFISY